jgi:hypothetical protein
MMAKRKEEGDFWTRRGSSATKGKRTSLAQRREEVAGASDSKNPTGKKRLSVLGGVTAAADDVIHMAPPAIGVDLG